VIVILCHPDDAAALWLHGTWRALGIAGIELVAVEQLVFSRSIVHRLADGGDTGAVRLADGRTLRPDAIAGLVNRVQYLPTQHFAAASPDDRAYATAELSAFMLAWLNSIAGRVLNPARPVALGGGTFARPTVLHLAAVAGLPTTTWRSSAHDLDDEGSSRLAPTHAATVFDGRLFGPLLPRPLQDGCRRLAALLGVPLLQVLLHQSRENGWRLVDATGAADFRIGGRALAAAIAKAMAA
jgi:hypothetical protein